MKPNQKQDHKFNLSDHPIVVILGSLASLAALIYFATGRNLPELFIMPPTPVTNVVTLTASATVAITHTETQPQIISQTSTPRITLQPTGTTPIEITPPQSSLTPTVETWVLKGSPYFWLPDSSDIPEDMKYQESGGLNNEEVSKNYENPTEQFQRFNQWGRIESYFTRYLNKDGCNSKSGLRDLSVQATVYETSQGAEKAFDWLIPYFKDRFSEIKGDKVSIGEKGYISWYEDISDCEQTEDLLFIDVMFRRYNVIGSVTVGGVSGTITEEELQSLAVRLAQLIDLRLVSDAEKQRE